MKVPRFQFVGWPACLLGLPSRLLVSSAKLDIDTGGIRPAIKYRNGLYEETKSARTNFGDHLSSQFFIREDFLQIVKAPGWESFSLLKFMLELLRPLRILRFHQVEPAGPIAWNARIHKYVSVNRTCKRLPDGGEQRSRTAVGDECQRSPSGSMCESLRNGVSVLFPKRFL